MVLQPRSPSAVLHSDLAGLVAGETFTDTGKQTDDDAVS